MQELVDLAWPDFALPNLAWVDKKLAAIEPQQWVKLVRRWVLKLVFKSLSHFFVSRG